MRLTVPYSRLAESDLQSIADYTVEQWGEAQASRYLNGIEDCCERIASYPALGRTCDEVCRGLRRVEHESHVVFFDSTADAVRILRVLHKSMVPDFHNFQE